MIETMFKIIDKTELIIEDYVLDILVHFPLLENRIRSYRLGEEDIISMSKKGYKIFDGNKGRFIKEIPEVMKQRIV